MWFLVTSFLFWIFRCLLVMQGRYVMQGGDDSVEEATAINIRGDTECSVHRWPRTCSHKTPLLENAASGLVRCASHLDQDSRLGIWISYHGLPSVAEDKPPQNASPGDGCQRPGAMIESSELSMSISHLG